IINWLCGREFIRAVIFTCGGSRWRRSLDLKKKKIRTLSCYYYFDTIIIK
uniref:Uncharacterized protein n=1 Tax=Cyprinus carpio TaxID=7962 RepID=A0A8C2PVW4_CYPCA